MAVPPAEPSVAPRPIVALVPWGQVIEDYLDAIGLDVDGFVEEMGGGWLFGWVEALATAGVGSVLVCVSASVSRPTRRTHRATGAPLWLLPPTAAWRAAQGRVADRYAWSPSPSPSPSPSVPVGPVRPAGSAGPAGPMGPVTPMDPEGSGGFDGSGGSRGSGGAGGADGASEAYRPRGSGGAGPGRRGVARRGVARVGAMAAHHALPWLATPPLALARVLRAERCRALVCQEYEDARFDACVAVGRACGIPVVGTFQGGDASRTPLERRTRRRAVRAASGLVVGSAPEAHRVRRAYGLPAERVHAVPNPLPLGDWPVGDRAAARRALGLAPDAGVVAWHGRVELGRKGLDVLADAWDRVTAARPGRPAVLLLCGTGPDAATLRDRFAATAAARPGTEVRWHDEYVLDRAPIRAHLAAADVGVLPSRHEGFPVALAEMMASGRAVVATDVPGVADMLPGGEADGGLVVPPGDAGALATALGALLDDRPRAHALGPRARRRVATTLSPDAVGAALAIALGLAGGPSPPPGTG